MQALRTAVHSRYYESYRVKRLTEMGFADTNERGETVSAREALEAKRQEHLRDLASREEKMRQVFVQKVRRVCPVEACLSVMFRHGITG